MNLNETLQQAVACHQAGQLPEAEELYLSILKVEPNHPDANHNLGLMALQLDKAEMGFPYLETAWRADPSVEQYWFSLTECLLAMGHSSEALLLIKEAIRSGIKSPQAQQLLVRAKGGGGKAQPSSAVAQEIFSLFNKAHYAELEGRAKSLVELYPTWALGWSLLGLAMHRQGKAGESALRRAVALTPNDAEAHNNLGVVLNAQGSVDAAAASFRKALKINPKFADAHCNLAMVLQSKGQLKEAMDSLSQAVRINPYFAEALSNLGNTLRAHGQLAGAVECYRRALKAKPDLAEAHSNLGVALKDLGQFDDAVASCRRALQIKPYFAEAFNNLGAAHLEQGRLDEAEASYRRALEIKSDSAEVLNNLGAALHELGRLDEAEACYRRALEIKPDYVGALSNLAATLKGLGRLDEAEDSCRRALQIKPDSAEAHGNLGSILKDMGRLDDAEASCRRALQINPDFAGARSNLLFCLDYHPDRSAEEIYRAYQEHDLCHGIPLRSAWRNYSNDPSPNRRLRVGYVSPDFRYHVCHLYVEPLLSHHDKTQVEVYAYAELAREDHVTRRYKSYVEHWIPTKGMSDEALAERIRSDGIDILVDLAGHTANNRLPVFARKPAPVSLSWLIGSGYTSGLSAIDYVLADEALIPIGSEGLFTEQPWRITTPAWCYRPNEGMGEVNALPAQQRGYITFGVLTRSIRINHRTIRVWSELLKAVPNARLVIDNPSYKDAAMQERLASSFAEYGIARNRLDIGNVYAHPWEVLRGIDIGLDCFPNNTGTSLLVGLYMGVPFITLAGRPSLGRIGCDILQGAGHPEWIAESEEEYLSKAVALANDLDRLAAYRASLRAEMERSPLLDEAGFARRVEDAYRSMWKIWCEKNDK